MAGPEAPLEREFVLGNQVGLHARPAALLVQTVAPYEARVQVLANRRTADARSILGLLSLGAGHGATITVRAAGPQAAAALDAVAALIAGGFGERAQPDGGAR